jgi:hypothetical protein
MEIKIVVSLSILGCGVSKVLVVGQHLFFEIGERMCMWI